jgi:hypothetical protein
VRKGIISLINDASEDDLPKITAADEIVACMARAFEDGWKDAKSVFDMLDDAKKLQVRVLHAASPPPLADAHPLCCSLTQLPTRAAGLPHAESRFASTL